MNNPIKSIMNCLRYMIYDLRRMKYNNFAYNWDYGDHGDRWMSGLPQRSRFERLLRMNLDYTAEVLRTVRCGIFGHDYVDESIIGPDSGTEIHSCTRCCYSWKHTYY